MLRKGGKDSASERDVPQLHSDPCRLGKPEPDDDDEDDEDVDDEYENGHNNMASGGLKTSG